MAPSVFSDLLKSGASFSGSERNHLFLNVGGERFEDVSALSGLDSEADGRSFALLDFDRDGYQDVVLVNANAPTLELFQNRAGRVAGGNRMVALRFEGANDRAEPSPGRSNRDGYGVQVEADLGAFTLVREHRAGEGFAAQNSATMVLGIGARDRIEKLVVRWPSGTVQELVDVPAGRLLTVYEDASRSPTGETFVQAPYRRAEVSLADRRPTETPRPIFALHGRAASAAPLTLYTTMATWCASCRGELPQWAHLQAHLPAGSLDIVAVPIDEDDTVALLDAYVAEHRPAYRMLPPLTRAERAGVNVTVLAELGRDGLPASVLTDRAGRILGAFWGAPTLSTVRGALASAPVAPAVAAAPSPRPDSPTPPAPRS
jgi:thiol-disulfide isomerase/thioredoxin